jgi:hypothetical protein
VLRLRKSAIVAAVLAIIATGGFLSTEDLWMQSAMAGRAATGLGLTWGQTGAAHGLRELRIRIQHPDGSAAGSLAFEELAGASRIRVRADALVETGFVLLRPGTCFAKLPPPNRSVHPYFGSAGELWIGFETLQRSAFAAEVVGNDGRTLACGHHAGAVPLPANSSGVPPDGRARWRNGALYFSSNGVAVTVMPSSNGRRTRVSARTDAGGSNGVLAHLRPGSCRKVAAGREWPMWMQTNAGAEAGTAHGTVILAIPFVRIRREPFAFEVHDDVIGVKVAYCVDLHPGA